MVRCPACRRRFPKQELVPVRVKRSLVECGKCSAEVPLTDSYFGLCGLGYICSECQSYVAVVYGRTIVNPLDVIKPIWNPSILSRGESVGPDLIFARCRTKKDYLTLRILQVMAKEEESSFLFFREHEASGALYLRAHNPKYVGFIIWNVQDNHAILRQIFIAPEEHGKGLATRLVNFWVSNYADKVSARFGIESPNESALNLHKKLGHLADKKCFILPSFR